MSHKDLLQRVHVIISKNVQDKHFRWDIIKRIEAVRLKDDRSLFSAPTRIESTIVWIPNRLHLSL
jgi:hypothetical protein